MQCVVYDIKCDLCDADYVGYNYTARHLHQRIAKHKNSATGRHFLQAHGSKNVLKEYQFKVSRKCQGKFDCLVYEMLLIRSLKPYLKYISTRTPYVPNVLFNFHCSLSIYRLLIYYFSFSIYRLQFSNYFDLIITFS